MEYRYDSQSNTVTAIMHANQQMQDTKLTWTLSSDKLTYTRVFDANTQYTTLVQDIYGNETLVDINITTILPTITMEYIYNQDNNTVTAIMHSNGALKDTKPSWTLSADRLSYTKIFEANDIYDTQVEDIYGNVVIVSIEITKIAPTITVEYIRNNDNTVTVILHSNEALKDVKPTWTLSEDKLNYTKTFSTNENYSLEVEDIYGNKTEVTITVFISNSSDFANLDESKYPGYKALLQEVQQKHPNWTIKIVYTGLDWNNVLDIQSGYSNGEPYSLTQTSGAWRDSADNNSYQGGWYKASREAIAYMMDPRNSLDQYYIFQFQNLSSTSGVYTDIEKMINGTYLANNYNKANIINAFLSASKNYNVSAYHLVSRMIQEQTNGWCANGYQYQGRTVYNFANIGATGSTTADIIRNGAEYAYNNHWFSPEMCIQGTAAFLYNNYFKNGQNTQYFQKYNVVTSNPYTNQYMQNIRAANDEGYRVAKAYESNGQLDLHFEFSIPVYENMPTTACLRPKT